MLGILLLGIAIPVYIYKAIRCKDKTERIIWLCCALIMGVPLGLYVAHLIKIGGI